MQNGSAACLMVGGIREDYCITHDGRAISGVLGGNAIYAAVGARLWSKKIAVVSRVGSNFPLEWFDQIAARGISTQGVRVIDHPLDTRTFYAYRSLEERIDTHPAIHYQRAGLRFPKALLGYRTSTEGQDQRQDLNPTTVRTTDVPEGILEGVDAVHLAPADFLTHMTLPAYLTEHGIGTITLDPSVRYMNPGFKQDLPGVLRGIRAFLPSVYEARSFLGPLEDEIWAMSEAFGSMGPEVVVIKAGASGQYLLDSMTNRRWHLPAYPARPRDVTGAGDAFCGGFLTGLVETGDPLQAAMRGNVAASFVIEGSGALYALDTPADLVEARFASLRERVHRV